ncbi:hypothetical protein LG201_12175 [Methylobacillus gramineus]|uniref:hypothetical protein n=1 Tax=Methylobacillus gramineus TaxID=755169 RepID=UPI001D000AA0|nr:hypothetical protein [Methylobacillus gramineus]MCB5185961.1 hypothetical protein [Methylobacillus gramineus]
MKKLLLTLMILLLPLHSVWSIAAGYCQHDAADSQAHFGHHTHQMDADNSADNDSPDGSSLTAGVHHDCNIHMLSWQLLELLDIHAGSAFLSDFPAYHFIFPGRIDRPNWQSAA